MGGIGSPPVRQRRGSNASRGSHASGSKNANRESNVPFGSGGTATSSRAGWDSGTSFRMSRSAILGGKLKLMNKIYAGNDPQKEAF